MSSLKEWLQAFVKNKDIIKQQLVSLEEKGNIIHAAYKGDKVQDYFIFDTITALSAVFEAAKKSDENPNYSVNVVCYNTAGNLAVLQQHWQQCIPHQRLMFYFVNPKSLTDIKWIINPWLHNRVSDPSSLATGLKSIFNTVEEWKG